MASFAGLIDVLKRQVFMASKNTPIKTLLTIVVVFTLEKVLTKTNFFKCPKTNYQVYSAMFLFVPALCLTGLTLITNNSFWDSATSRSEDRHHRRVICSKICFDLTRAALVGLAWLALAFGTTDFYVCLRVGSTKSDIRSDKMRTQSTVIAWSMLLAIIVASLCHTAMRKCCCRTHHKECRIQTLQDYERLETEAAISKFEEELPVLAEKQGKKAVMEIFNEVDDGKDAREVVKKAKKMLLTKYSNIQEVLENGYVCNDTVDGMENERRVMTTTV